MNTRLFRMLIVVLGLFALAACEDKAPPVAEPTPPNINLPVCGNNICDVGEDTVSCPADCKTPTPEPSIVCGNGTCEEGENVTICPQDCQLPSPQPSTVCGNGVCEEGETTATCSLDCPAPAACDWQEVNTGLALSARDPSQNKINQMMIFQRKQFIVKGYEMYERTLPGGQWTKNGPDGVISLISNSQTAYAATDERIYQYLNNRWSQINFTFPSSIDLIGFYRDYLVVVSDPKIYLWDSQSTEIRDICNYGVQKNATALFNTSTLHIGTTNGFLTVTTTTGFGCESHLDNGSKITEMDKASNHVLLVGTENMGLLTFGSSPVFIDFERLFVKALKVTKNSANQETIYVSLADSNGANGKVYKSTDIANRTNWTEVPFACVNGGATPTVSTFSATIDTLYVGTENNGVWKRGL